MSENVKNENSKGLRNNPPKANTVRVMAKKAIKEGLRQGYRYKSKTGISGGSGSAGIMWPLEKKDLNDLSKPSRYKSDLDNPSSVVNTSG